MTKIFKNKWFYVTLSAIVLITVNNIFAFSDKYSDYRNSKETFREFYSRILKEMKYSDAYNVFLKHIKFQNVAMALGIYDNDIYIDKENELIDMNMKGFKTLTKHYDKYIKDTDVGDVNKFNGKKKVTVILKPLEEILVDEAYKNLMSLLKDYYNEKVFGLVVNDENKEFNNVSLYIFGFDFESDSDWSLIHYMYIDRKHIKIK